MSKNCQKTKFSIFLNFASIFQMTRGLDLCGKCAEIGCFHYPLRRSLARDPFVYKHLLVVKAIRQIRDFLLEEFPVNALLLFLQEDLILNFVAPGRRKL